MATAGASAYGAIPGRKRRVEGKKKEDEGGEEQGRRRALKLCKQYK